LGLKPSWKPSQKGNVPIGRGGGVPNFSEKTIARYGADFADQFLAYLAMPTDLPRMDCSTTKNISPRDLFNKDMISTHQKIENKGEISIAKL
jgi:hypothetical protein